MMLVNISPAAALERPTLNSLRYGQVVTATASATKKKRAGGGGGARKKKPPLRAKPCDPAVLDALRKVYAEHVPEKTAEAVDVIIEKFAGREAELLGKVRAKYEKKQG